MMKVASGGELSRFLLALKVALADRGSAPTLVFDEIDTGVGGAVADAIGQRLARLARRVQVLSVRHAPQVAARAATHLLISKSGGADRVTTGVAEMDRPARQEEPRSSPVERLARSPSAVPLKSAEPGVQKDAVPAEARLERIDSSPAPVGIAAAARARVALTASAARAWLQAARTPT